MSRQAPAPTPHLSPRQRHRLRLASAPPPLPLLFAADADAGGGSVLALASEPPTPAERVGFGAAARAAWQDAHAAAAAGVPLRWQTLDPLADPPAFARRVARARRPGTAALAGADWVDGPSFGLAFFLAIAARASGAALRADTVALAALGGDGVLRPVGGLGVKLWLATTQVPGVRRALVAASQLAEAEAAVQALRAEGVLGEAFEVVAVVSAAAALGPALASPLDAPIAAAAHDPERREEWIAALCHLTLDGHDRVSHWPPIAAATAAARAAFADAALPAQTRAMLEVADAIAHRHATLPRPWPALAALDGLPLPRRLLLLAHATQHAADLADPPLPTLQPWLDRHLRRDADAFELHCRLAGAWGRLLAARAEPAEALEWQRFAAEHRLAIGELRGVAHPLAEWLRLAAVLADPAALDAARALWRRAEAMGAIGRRDRPFLLLSDARAAAALHQPGATDALRAVRDHRDAPLHVRCSAARWLARGGDGPQPLLKPVGADGGRVERLFGALAGLDACASTDSPAGAYGPAVSVVRALLPGPVAHLRDVLGASADDAALAQALVRHFPY